MCERERQWCAVHASYSLVFVRARFVCVREEKVGKVFVCVSAFAIVYVLVSPYMCVLSLFRERKDE